jgi:hypothetical protein
MPHPEIHSDVILVDDGELADVRELLDSLQVEYAEAPSLGAIEAESGCALLISSARHALARPVAVSVEPPWQLHVVVYDAISEGLRRLLSRSGCDVAVGRPLQPAMMQLLVSHALYAGPERRETGRAAMSAPVRIAGPLGDSVATLLQISERGCGLLVHGPAEVGDDVALLLPPELTGASVLPLDGTVIDVTAVAGSSDRQLALVFESVPPKVKRVLQTVMERHSLGLTPRHAASAAEAIDDSADLRAAGPEDRRGPRKLFAGRVAAARPGEARVMIGRDLSVGGMRVRPIEGLRVGDEFELALYGDGGALVLEAVVSRDDGWDGMVLQFQCVTPTTRTRLERMVESLPAGRPGKGVGARAPGLLVSEILETE